MVDMKIIFCIFFSFFALWANEKNEVLLLHSYNKGLKWSDGISEGINSVFAQNTQYEITTEYMDTKKNDTKEYFDALVKLYEKKFEKRQYKAIITADNYAFTFALQHHEELFNGAPIVFCGVENFSRLNIPLQSEQSVTGVIEYKDFKKNIQLIAELIPNLQTLYIISDQTLSSLAIKDQILNTMRRFESQFKIVYDNEIYLPELKQKLEKLPTHSAILFTSLYIDKFKRYIPYNEIRQFFKNTSYPIFAINTIHLEEGVLGGVMIDPREQGVLAAKKVLQIIDGKLPASIPIDTPKGKYYFDYNVLKNFDIKNENMPILATIVNRPKSFLDENREFVNSVFVVVPLLLILLLILLVTVVRKTRLEITLLEQNKLDSVLLNNIKNAIFWESNEGIVLGCNATFCSFLNKQKEEIIGQHISTLMPKNELSIGKLQGDFEEKKLTLLDSEGKKIYALVRRKRYHDKNDKVVGIVTVLSDHTNMRKLELQRQKDEQFIIQRSKSSEIGEMVTSIAHQWKKPLIEISTIAQELLFIRKKRDITLEETQLHVDEIMTQVQYMTKTIDDFRSFIKPSLQQSYFSVKKAIDETIAVIEHNIKYNYIELSVKFKDQEDFTILGYQNEFKQALISIINNAIDGIKKRKQKEEFEGSIKIKVFYDKNYICISIKDNGIGIPKTNLKTIFKPFYTTKKQGDGFGLYMAKLLIEDKMNGRIKALEYEKGAHIMTCFQKSSEE
ncbi:histidine kinase [Candidatus Marinarcus aquaticus]|uniref:histidine kinase n=2 Tax=Candidatus Marinarcus aquaticus TaxID=2044504 RepID=A0A4Q0XLM5_9BACT|nr:histidine kinase [Candidatus Marinarcus aquaticus]